MLQNFWMMVEMMKAVKEMRVYGNLTKGVYVRFYEGGTTKDLTLRFDTDDTNWTTVYDVIVDGEVKNQSMLDNFRAVCRYYTPKDVDIWEYDSEAGIMYGKKCVLNSDGDWTKIITADEVFDKVIDIM